MQESVQILPKRVGPKRFVRKLNKSYCDKSKFVWFLLAIKMDILKETDDGTVNP